MENLVFTIGREAKQNKISAKPDENVVKELEQETEALKTLRLYFAKRNRIVSALQRQIDDSPNRPELAQYQRRFLELYNQGEWN